MILRFPSFNARKRGKVPDNVRIVKFAPSRIGWQEELSSVCNVNKKTFVFAWGNYPFAAELSLKGINNSRAAGFWNIVEEKQLMGLAESRSPR
jgi:hypothetical protein